MSKDAYGACEFLTDHRGVCGEPAKFRTLTPSAIMARWLHVCGRHRLVAQRRGWTIAEAER